MTFIFLTLLLISIFLLINLKSLKQRFDSFEIFILFMFTSYMCQNFFYMLSSPYDRLRVAEEHLAFWSARLQFGIIIPSLLMWVMYALRTKIKLSVKIMICFTWIAGGVLIEKLLLLSGVLVSKSDSWYPSIDLILAMIVISICVYFLEVLPPILRREGVLKDEGDL
jgi:hypothetical protein